VRTEKERATAKLPGTKLLDDAQMAAIEKLPRETPLAFHCHHGGRSRAAAEHFLKLGFKTVYNMAGGIEAWSKDVDPSVPRY
jgi:monothiol glutaredoxin